MLESFFNNVEGLQENPTRMLSCEISEMFKSTYFEEHQRMTAK